MADNATTKPLLTNFFERVQGNASEDLLSVEWIDPDREPEIAKEYGLTERDKGKIVVEFEGNREDFRMNPSELAATSDIRDLNENFFNAVYKAVLGAKSVYVTTGHRELAISGSGPAVLTEYSDALSSIFALKELQDLGSKGVPDDCELLVIPNVMIPFSDDEITAISNYLNRGGALFVALTPMSDEDRAVASGAVTGAEGAEPVDIYAPLLNLLNLKYQYDMIVDHKNFYAREQILLARDIESHPSVGEVEKSGMAVMFPFSGSLLPADPANKEIKVTPVIKTSAEAARTKQMVVQNQPRLVAVPESIGEHTVAVAVTGPASGSSVTTSDNPEGDTSGNKRDEWRAFVVSSVEALVQPLNGPLWRSTASWLAPKDAFDNVTFPEFEPPQVYRTSDEMRVVFWASILLIPMILIALGLGFLAYRSKRSERGVH